MTFGSAAYAEPRHAGSFRHRSLFTGANVREAVNDGRADFRPVHLSEIPALVRTGDLAVDVALIHVSPPTSTASAPTASVSSAPRRRRSARGP
jgi:acetyl-CoA hydrolase